LKLWGVALGLYLVNWSEYIRDSIQKKIDEQNLKSASAKIDEVRTRTKPVPTEELVSWISKIPGLHTDKSANNKPTPPKTHTTILRTMALHTTIRNNRI